MKIILKLNLTLLITVTAMYSRYLNLYDLRLIYRVHLFVSSDCNLTKYFSGDEIQKKELGGACTKVSQMKTLNL